MFTWFEVADISRSSDSESEVLRDLSTARLMPRISVEGNLIQGLSLRAASGGHELSAVDEWEGCRAPELLLMKLALHKFRPARMPNGDWRLCHNMIARTFPLARVEADE